MSAIIPQPNAETAIETSARMLLDAFGANAHLPVLFLSSGGSAFSILERLCAAPLPPRMSMGMLDERFSRDSSINNYAQLTRHAFYAHAQRYSCACIASYPQENESLKMFARRIEQNLRAWRAANPDGAIIATMGMGEDGHTAGIMPDPNNEAEFNQRFVNTNQWIVGHNAQCKTPHPLRATATVRFLATCVDYAIMLIYGAQKKAAYRRLIAPEGFLYETPARVVHLLKHAAIVSAIH